MAADRDGRRHVHIEIDETIVRRMKVMAVAMGQPVWRLYERAALKYLRGHEEPTGKET